MTREVANEATRKLRPPRADTPQQMAMALRALAGQTQFAVRLNAGGRWYVDVGQVVIVDDTTGTAQRLRGRGDTPDEALRDCWSHVPQCPNQPRRLVRITACGFVEYVWRAYVGWLELGRQGEGLH